MTSIGFEISLTSLMYRRDSSLRLFGLRLLRQADGLVERYSVAGDVGYRRCGVVGCFAEKVEKELGILVIPSQ